MILVNLEHANKDTILTRQATSNVHSDWSVLVVGIMYVKFS